jgi:hypothetical protein
VRPQAEKEVGKRRDKLEELAPEKIKEEQAVKSLVRAWRACA